jgi:hypothetical protein
LPSNARERLHAKIKVLRSARTITARTYQGTRSHVSMESNSAGPSQQPGPIRSNSTQLSIHHQASRPSRVRTLASGIVLGGALGRSAGVRIHGAARHTGRIQLGQPVRPMHELFPDNEEELSHSEAVTFGAQPVSTLQLILSLSSHANV